MDYEYVKHIGRIHNVLGELSKKKDFTVLCCSVRAYRYIDYTIFNAGKVPNEHSIIPYSNEPLIEISIIDLKDLPKFLILRLDACIHPFLIKEYVEKIKRSIKRISEKYYDNIPIIIFTLNPLVLNEFEIEDIYHISTKKCSNNMFVDEIVWNDLFELRCFTECYNIDERKKIYTSGEIFLAYCDEKNDDALFEA